MNTFTGWHHKIQPGNYVYSMTVRTAGGFLAERTGEWKNTRAIRTDAAAEMILRHVAEHMGHPAELLSIVKFTAKAV